MWKQDRKQLESMSNVNLLLSNRNQNSKETIQYSDYINWISNLKNWIEQWINAEFIWLLLLLLLPFDYYIVEAISFSTIRLPITLLKQPWQTLTSICNRSTCRSHFDIDFKNSHYGAEFSLSIVTSQKIHSRRWLHTMISTSLAITTTTILSSQGKVNQLPVAVAIKAMAMIIKISMRSENEGKIIAFVHHLLRWLSPENLFDDLMILFSLIFYIIIVLSICCK